MGVYEDSRQLHYSLKGKLEIKSKVKIDSKKALSLAYTPGVAEPCRIIHSSPSSIYDLTMKGNCVAVVSDGSAVLGLGNIGAQASLPVMEGKALLFKELAGVDAFPICIDSQDVEEIVRVVELIAPVFGGINLEDISAPRCFLIEEKLKERLDIPIFHDDQHGTAVVVLAALLNALKLTGRKVENTSVVINGAGAAGIAVSTFLHHYGFGEIILCDSKGIIYEGRKEGMNFAKERVARFTNPEKIKGGLEEAVKGKDVFIGLSVPGVLTGSMVRKMNKDSIILALANPEPEIHPEEAKRAGAKIIGTGRSDYPNQINNVLGFPGIFKGALSVRAKEINEEMKISASQALARVLSPEELREDRLLPLPLDKRVVPAVSQAVSEAAIRTGVAQR